TNNPTPRTKLLMTLPRKPRIPSVSCARFFAISWNRDREPGGPCLLPDQPHLIPSFSARAKRAARNCGILSMEAWAAAIYSAIACTPSIACESRTHARRARDDLEDGSHVGRPR